MRSSRSGVRSRQRLLSILPGFRRSQDELRHDSLDVALAILWNFGHWFVRGYTCIPQRASSPTPLAIPTEDSRRPAGDFPLKRLETFKIRTSHSLPRLLPQQVRRARPPRSRRARSPRARLSLFRNKQLATTRTWSFTTACVCPSFLTAYEPELTTPLQAFPEHKSSLVKRRDCDIPGNSTASPRQRIEFLSWPGVAAGTSWKYTWS